MRVIQFAVASTVAAVDLANLQELMQGKDMQEVMGFLQQGDAKNLQEIAEMAKQIEDQDVVQDNGEVNVDMLGKQGEMLKQMGMVVDGKIDQDKVNQMFANLPADQANIFAQLQKQLQAAKDGRRLQDESPQVNEDDAPAVSGEVTSEEMEQMEAMMMFQDILYPIFDQFFEEEDSLDVDGFMAKLPEEMQALGLQKEHLEYFLQVWQKTPDAKITKAEVAEDFETVIMILIEMGLIEPILSLVPIPEAEEIDTEGNADGAEADNDDAEEM